MEVSASCCPPGCETQSGRKCQINLKNKHDSKELNALPVIPMTFSRVLMALYSKAQSTKPVCGGVLGSGTESTSFFIEQYTSLVEYTSLFCVNSKNKVQPFQ